MNRNITGFLAAILILAAPCAQAGLDSWLSSILPAKMRATDEMRSHVYRARDHLNIQYPILTINKALEDGTLARAENNALFSVITIDNDQVSELSEDQRRGVAFHEAGHVLHNHARVDRTLMAVSTSTYVASMLSFSYGLLKKRHLSLPTQYKVLTFSALSLLGSYIAHSHTDDYHIEKMRTGELQADAVKAKLTLALHGPAPLEKELAALEQLSDTYGYEYHRCSEQHPTIAQEITLLRDVLQSSAAHVTKD